MTIGDVLAAIAAVVTLVSALTSLTVFIALAISTKVTKTATVVSADTRTVVGRGVVLFLLLLFAVIGFHNAGNGPQKLLLGLALISLGAAAAFGSAVVCTIIAGRMTAADARVSPLRALFQSALLCTGACLVPAVGWLAVAPCLFVVCLGAASIAIWPPHTQTTIANVPSSAQEAVLS